MLELLVEFFGTFVFLYVIQHVGQPIPIVVALLSMIYFGGDISGGHFNPAVSFMKYVSGALPINQLFQYVIVQLMGGALAFYFTQVALIKA
jgi:aquaporin Z